MKAVLCKVYGPPESLVIEEVEPLRAGRGQVVIAVKACGVNFPDALIIQGKYQVRPPMPFSPGSEIAGIVKEIGEGVEPGSVKEGDRVIAFTGWGGFAEEVVVKANQLIPIPADMDFVTASAFILTYGTAYHALKDRAQLAEGEKLLVLGAAGGVGIAAIQLGKAMGAHVIAAASNDEKLQVCRQNGADALINYSTQDLKEQVKQLSGGQGVDVIFDPVGGPYSEAALRGMAWQGRYLVIGFAAGEIPRIPLNLALLKGCSIVGVFWGSFTEREPQHNLQNVQQLLALFSAGKIRPLVSATYPLERAAAALNDMMNRRVKGKVVLLAEEL
ncbi:MAG TPA: NADPH:quinone oxidoreductase family protein [Ktedonobacteraceae bacterium]|nr:NADPH:quinone oxidoreductase family protein [Ktedonobacteraceae bacterium]